MRCFDPCKFLESDSQVSVEVYNCTVIIGIIFSDYRIIKYIHDFGWIFIIFTFVFVLFYFFNYHLLRIPDLIIKLYVFWTFFWCELFPLQRVWLSIPWKSNTNHSEFEIVFFFLMTCRYLNLVNKKIIS